MKNRDTGKYVYNMWYNSGLSIQQIANMLGVTYNAVQKHISGITRPFDRQSINLTGFFQFSKKDVLPQSPVYITRKGKCIGKYTPLECLPEEEQDKICGYSILKETSITSE